LCTCVSGKLSLLYRQFQEDPCLVNLLKKIMATGVMFLSDKIVVNTANKTFAKPWHMDYFYLPDTRPKLSVWIPFDDKNADNGMCTVASGSHKNLGQ
jgi:ectoine hydroxylase-related dioxygenase (phytanoyl-CoA dioxygenase family)